MNKILQHTNYELFKKHHLLFILTLAATAICIMAGSMKISGSVLFAMMFENRYGHPLWFMFFVGYVEIFGAISLWLKRWSFYGAQGLLVIALGATATHLSMGDGPDMAGMAWGFTVVMILICLYQWRNRVTDQVTE